MKDHSKKRQRGFSLLELLMSMALMLIVSGAVFSQISNIVNRYGAEESRMTAVDDTREFVDQMVRDLHQTNFPHMRIFSPNFTGNVPYSNQDVAAGLVIATPTLVQFEANLDDQNNGAIVGTITTGGSGVQVIVYRLVDTNGNPVANTTNCPCVLQRGQMRKQPGINPENQTAVTPINFTSEVDNVINPANEPPFRFFSNTGVELTNLPTFATGVPNQGGTDAVFSIKISVTVQGKTADPVTKLFPEVTYTATAQMNN